MAMAVAMPVEWLFIRVESEGTDVTEDREPFLLAGPRDIFVRIDRSGI
jgi:hypothetical protein